MHEEGFTTMETTAALLIVGIMLASTLPGFLGYRATLRGGQVVNQLEQDLRAARQAAVTQRTPVIISFGNGVSTTDIVTYTVHVDANGDRVYQAGERRWTRTLPAETKIARTILTPPDSLTFDLSGVLWPGTLGGGLIVSGRGTVDTLLVSSAGVVYRP